MKKIGYDAVYEYVDTKQFYIPHTRQRGYLLAVKRPSNDEKPAKKKRVQNVSLADWKNLLKEMKRPASATLDAFMLPNDDPRVARGRARLTNPDGASANAVDWVKCEGRHQLARSTEELGDKRPLTGWSDSGQTTMPGFAWNEWTNQQVHRIHDLME